MKSPYSINFNGCYKMDIQASQKKNQSKSKKVITNSQQKEFASTNHPIR